MRKAGEPGKKLVAVVTPVARIPLQEDEKISLGHLRHHLEGFDRYIIGQKSLPASLSDFQLREFPMQCFSDVYAYNRLMMSKVFYEAFTDYEYVLIYQTDCLVFRGTWKNGAARAGTMWERRG